MSSSSMELESATSVRGKETAKLDPDPSSEFSMAPTLLFKVSSAQEELIGKMTLEEKAGQLTILAEPRSEVGVVLFL